ncbi:FmdE family protein [Fretibacterium sp. OH1220_COT-178]|uniref:FmdE family protein n=1 Tax=Fretibacterium sp. OH1220_COT-178 TaxID=2491047 RepID=UPI000F5D8439|nr:FmdE family protein [Fretibacterium sp. OH1220_COT-178]RRD65264.1 formylmethanofuran dehydrogenase [Fretibacterium sp. OH1220_COT-178]
MRHEIDFYWNESVAFHGHACPGLALGCRVAFDAARMLGVDERCGDEEGVCIAETDACGIDAIQSVWGCTMGKGNLLLKPRGKQAFTFYRRGEPEGIRIYWNAPRSDERTREERIEHYLKGPAEELYRTARVAVPAPAAARISPSLSCSACGERTAEPMVRLLEGHPYCLDCFEDPSRILR